MKATFALILICLLALCACATPAPTDQPTPVLPTPTPEAALYPPVNLPTLGKLSLNALAVEHDGPFITTSACYIGIDVREDFFSRPDSFMLRVRVTDEFLPVLGFYFEPYSQTLVDWMGDAGEPWRTPIPDGLKGKAPYAEYMSLRMQELPDSYILRDVEILDVYHTGEALTLARGDSLSVAEYAQYGPTGRRGAPAFYYYDPATLPRVFAPENCGVYGTYMVSDAEYVITGYYRMVTEDPTDGDGSGLGGGIFPPITDTGFAQVKGHFCVDEELLAAGVAEYGPFMSFPHHYYYVSDEEIDGYLDENPDFDGMTTLRQRLDYWRQENAQQVLEDYFAAVEAGYVDGVGSYSGPAPRPTLPPTPVE